MPPEVSWETIKSEIKLAIMEAFREYTPQIVGECLKHIRLTEAECPARQIFNNDKNVELLFETRNKINNHLEDHQRRNSSYRWVVGLLVTAILGLAGILVKVWK